MFKGILFKYDIFHNIAIDTGSWPFLANFFFFTNLVHLVYFTDVHIGWIQDFLVKFDNEFSINFDKQKLLWMVTNKSIFIMYYIFTIAFDKLYDLQWIITFFVTAIS